MQEDLVPLLPFNPVSREVQLYLADRFEHSDDYNSSRIGHIVIDASQSGYRVPRGLDRCPCILPFSELVEMKKLKRPIFGVERFGLQGLDRWHAKNRFKNLIDAQLCRLAGNSSIASSCALTKIIAMCVLPFPVDGVDFIRANN